MTLNHAKYTYWGPTTKKRRQKARASGLEPPATGLGGCWMANFQTRDNS